MIGAKKLALVAALALSGASAMAEHIPLPPPPPVNQGEVSLKEFLLSTCIVLAEPTADNIEIKRVNASTCTAVLDMAYKAVDNIQVVAYNGWNNSVFEKTIQRERTQWLTLDGYAQFSCPARPFEVDTQATVTADILSRAASFYKKNRPLFCQ